MGQNIYMQFQNADRSKAIEEVMYQNDEEREDDLTRDGKKDESQIE